MSETFGHIVEQTKEGLVETFLAVCSVIGVFVSLTLLYRIAFLGSPASFIPVASGLLLIPFVHLFRKKLSTTTKYGVLIALCGLALIVNLQNQGLLSQAPLITIVIALLAVDLLEPKYHGAVIALTIITIFLSTIPHFFSVYDHSTLLSNNVAIVNRALTVAFLTWIALANHGKLIGKVMELAHGMETKNQELTNRNLELQAALDRIKFLEGFLSVCAWCKKVKTDEASATWIEMEEFLKLQIPEGLSHGMCPDCLEGALKEEST